MKRSFHLIALVITLGFASAAHAVTGWVTWAKVSGIVVNGNKTINIYTAENGGKWKGPGCPDADYLTVAATNPALNLIYSGLIAAKAANQRISVYFSWCANPFVAESLLME